MEKRVLQAFVIVLSLVPIGAGLFFTFISTGIQIDLDSHFRYLSGILFAIGLGFWSCVPGIERKTVQVRLLTGLVVVGGLARLYALIDTGVPSTPMVMALGMELVVTPVLCFWQSRIAHQHERILNHG